MTAFLRLLNPFMKYILPALLVALAWFYIQSQNAKIESLQIQNENLSSRIIAYEAEINEFNEISEAQRDLSQTYNQSVEEADDRFIEQSRQIQNLNLDESSAAEAEEIVNESLESVINRLNATTNR